MLLTLWLSIGMLVCMSVPFTLVWAVLGMVWTFGTSRAKCDHLLCKAPSNASGVPRLQRLTRRRADDFCLYYLVISLVLCCCGGPMVGMTADGAIKSRPVDAEEEV